MAKPYKLAHVVYMTRRFDEMLEWYKTVFEADVVYQNPAIAFMTYDDEHHRFAFANLNVLKPTGDGAAPTDIGVNHVAYTYRNVGDLLDNYERLKAAGIEPYWPVHHGMTLSMYYKDPDGNRMEFQVDTCSVAEANEMMLSEEFAANPVGVNYDPDALLAQHRSGVSFDVLMSRPKGPMAAIPLEHGLN
ncbi:MAG TPA: VOC family protein [Pyrinomonadaceae bacterium]|nr:VOC family protein [Pyrinomonadaceae bacterium]